MRGEEELSGYSVIVGEYIVDLPPIYVILYDYMRLTSKPIIIRTILLVLKAEMIIFNLSEKAETGIEPIAVPEIESQIA